MRKLLTSLGVALLLLVLLAVAVDAQTTYQRFENLWARTLRSTGDLTVGGAASVTGGAAVGGDLTVGGATTLGGAAAVSGALTAGGAVRLGAGDVLTVTNGGPLTAVRAFQQVTAGSAAGMTLTVLPTGTLLVLVNMGSNAVTITDTGTTMLAGNVALGQYDSLTVISDGTNMVELARANN